MSTRPNRFRVLIALSAAGMAVALISALETRIPWIAELCGVFGGGCRETASFTMFGVSVALLGIGYYAALMFVLLAARSQTLRLVTAGAGVELLFLYTMVDQSIFCPFCILNLLVIAALTVLTFEWERGWEALALALLFLVGLSIPFAQENGKPKGRNPDPVKSNVVARVDGAEITARALERATASRVYEARMNLYLQQRSQLERMTNDLLLQKEAHRIGTTNKDLRARILANVEPVGPEEVAAFITANPRIQETWQGTEAELRERILSHLRSKKNGEALKRHIEGLRKSMEVEIFLQEPPLPLTRVSLGNSPSQGPPDAPVTVVEFSDYLCPACRKAHEVSMEVREEYGDRVRWVFKDYPLDTHKGARTLAEAARCAREQDMFWEYQDMLFMAQMEVDREQLLAFSAELGMDTGRFEECLNSGRHRKDILADLRSGEEAGVDVTPTYIINGKIRPGTMPPEKLRGLIESELARAGAAGPPS